MTWCRWCLSSTASGGEWAFVRGQRSFTRQTYMMPLLVTHDNVLTPGRSNGTSHDFWLNVSAHGKELGFITVLPDGTIDNDGFRWWNAPGCCNKDNSTVDDLGFLSGLIEVGRTKGTQGPPRTLVCPTGRHHLTDSGPGTTVHPCLGMTFRKRESTSPST